MCNFIDDILQLYLLRRDASMEGYIARLEVWLSVEV